MDKFFSNNKLTLEHLKVINDFFRNKSNYLNTDLEDFNSYDFNLVEFEKAFNEIGAFDQLYNIKNRQLILADMFEYILLGRAFYSIGNRRGVNKNKEKFVKGIIHFVNLLMSFETITTNSKSRKKLLEKFKKNINLISKEDDFNNLYKINEDIGIPNSTVNKKLTNYFDSLLPKTAGGLWHELLVYIFIIRNDLGFILPMLLHQKIYSKHDHLVPPDFLLITRDKRIYGIEVGIKKEIQSGAFSLKTAIPTATIDTINSRNSDRCPICKKWIKFCPFIIETYSNFDNEIRKTEVKCLEECNLFTKEQIANGDCKYSKYSRKESKTLKYTIHPFADGKHYHYHCVLNNVDNAKKTDIINKKDNTAIKTHYPFYSGLNELIS